MTEDEFVVLSIAAHGQPMIPIGRWKGSTLSLAKLGYLQHTGAGANYVITAAGTAALATREEETDAAIGRMLVANAKVKNVHDTVRRSVEQAADLLATAARASSEVTGDAYETALDKWLAEVRKAVMEKRNG